MTASAAEPGRRSIRIGGVDVPAGRRRDVEIPVARLATGTWVSLPVAVLHGAHPGPALWLNGAVHGDELNGIEIVREVLRTVDPRRLSGTVLGVPIVNGFGLLQGSRYLPDRRDLNRSFPGSPRGSLAARLAHLFMEEVVERCAYGVDLHTGSGGRTNYPQVRGDLDEPEIRRMAEVFGAPVMIHARNRDGSLREEATRRGRHVLVYEAGEAGRFDSEAIRVGRQGVLRLLDALGMRTTDLPPAPPTQEVRTSRWIRAGRSGILRLRIQPGRVLAAGEELGVIADTFSRRTSLVRAPHEGVVLGISLNPLVNRGDAIAHLAQIGPHAS